LPENSLGLLPEELAIHYVEKVNGVTRVRRLEIGPDGETTDSWPEGFFEERLNELI